MHAPTFFETGGTHQALKPIGTAQPQTPAGSLRIGSHKQTALLSDSHHMPRAAKLRPTRCDESFNRDRPRMIPLQRRHRNETSHADLDRVVSQWLQNGDVAHRPRRLLTLIERVVEPSHQPKTPIAHQGSRKYTVAHPGSQPRRSAVQTAAAQSTVVAERRPRRINDRFRPGRQQEVVVTPFEHISDHVAQAKRIRSFQPHRLRSRLTKVRPRDLF